MGYGFAGEFSELWDGVAPLMTEMARTGLSVRRENDYLPIERFGMLEETFFSWSWTPLYGGTDKILGCKNIVRLTKGSQVLTCLFSLQCTVRDHTDGAAPTDDADNQ